MELCTEIYTNLQNMTSNTRYYWKDPVSWNVTNKWDPEKQDNKVVEPAIATLQPGSQRLFVHMIHSGTNRQTGTDTRYGIYMCCCTL